MPERRLVAFGRALREEGLQVGTGQINDFCEAAALVPPEDLYWAGRGTLVAKRDDVPVYDRVFNAFFGDVMPVPVETPQSPVMVRAASSQEAEQGTEGEQDVEPELLLASEIEILKEKSFARCTPEELEQLAELMARVKLAVPMRRSRRRKRAKSGTPDLRQTIRRSFRTGGEPIERYYKERRRRRRRLVLFLDVSGSMASYSRALLVFAHAALRADPRWEAYCFGTRLTRLTRVLKTSDPDKALEEATDEVFDWDGGTRIGESLNRFLMTQPEIARGSVVIICSDGLEVGDPSLLAQQMARLHRLAYRVIWLNPLKEDPAYEPLARGMAACLPYIDLFVSRPQPGEPRSAGRRPRRTVGGIVARPEAGPISAAEGGGAARLLERNRCRPEAGRCPQSRPEAGPIPPATSPAMGGTLGRSSPPCTRSPPAASRWSDAQLLETASGYRPARGRAESLAGRGAPGRGGRAPARGRRARRRLHRRWRVHGALDGSPAQGARAVARRRARRGRRVWCRAERPQRRFRDVLVDEVRDARRSSAVRTRRSSWPGPRPRPSQRSATFCRDNGIDAHFRHDGWLWAATSEAQIGAWDGVVEAMRAQAGVRPFELLEPDEVARRSGSSTHLAGVFEPTDGDGPAGAARARPAPRRARARRADLRALADDQARALASAAGAHGRRQRHRPSVSCSR